MWLWKFRNKFARGSPSHKTRTSGTKTGRPPLHFAWAVLFLCAVFSPLHRGLFVFLIPPRQIVCWRGNFMSPFCVYVRACVRACMRACACVCVCACVCAVFSSFFPSFQFLCKEGTVAELKPITIGQGLFLGEWYALRHGRGWILNLKNSQMFDLTSCFAQSGRRWTIPSEWCHQMNLL